MQASFRKTLLRASARVLLAAAAAVALAAGPQAQAQTFPSRPVKLVSPYTPGGTADILARALAEGMAKSLGQPVIVENVGGGGGTIGGMAAARAQPDGYTLFLGGLGINVIVPMMDTTQQFKPREQLVPISQVASYQQIIVARSDSPINTLAELIAAAKKDRGLSYGTSGVTTSNYLGTEVLKQEASFNLIHVPYKGEAPTLQDLIGGTLELANISVSVAMPYIQSGRLKAIVTMYPTRVKELPSVPSISETYPNVGVDPWFGLYTTKGTPPAVVERLNAAVRASLADKAVADTLQQRGYLVKPSRSAEEFARVMDAEGRQWQASLKKARLITD